MGDIGPVRSTYDVLPEGDFSPPAPVADPTPEWSPAPRDPVAREDELGATR